MLLYLFDYLEKYNSVFNVFGYLTLRAILGVLTALVICFVTGPMMIRRLSDYSVKQNIRSDGPQTHLLKAGTPTMGGGFLLLSILVSTLLWGDLENRYIWVVCFVTFSFGAIGAFDDIKKLIQGSSAGISARVKYGLQSAVGLIAAWWLFQTAMIPVETNLYVPFFKNIVIDLGAWFIVLTYFVIVGSSNAVNLTDGLDGLAIMQVRWEYLHMSAVIPPLLNIWRFHSSRLPASSWFFVPRLSEQA